MMLCWSIAYRKKAVGVWAWAMLGLTLDLLMHTPLGQQMLSYAILGWLVARMGESLLTRQKIATFVQILILLSLFALSSIVIEWIMGTGVNWDILSRTLVGALITPILCRFLTTNGRY
jgi:rod shape-determining protein MreD